MTLLQFHNFLSVRSLEIYRVSGCLKQFKREGSRALYLHTSGMCVNPLRSLSCRIRYTESNVVICGVARIHLCVARSAEPFLDISNTLLVSVENTIASLSESNFIGLMYRQVCAITSQKLDFILMYNASALLSKFVISKM